jgi:hypothetical protein
MLKFFIDDTLDEVEHLDMLFDAINKPVSDEMSMKEAMELKAAMRAKDEETNDEDDDSDEEE